MKKQNNKFNKIKEYLVNTLFPNDIKCISCGEELNQDSHNNLCTECNKSLPYIHHFCPRCGSPISINNDGVCINCKINNYHFIASRSVFVYNDMISSIIRRIKYKSRKIYIPALSNFLAENFDKTNFIVDMVTCVPSHVNREKTRKFNQSKLLAESFAEKVNLPFIEIADKIVDNPSQTSLDYNERKKNVENVYKLKPNIRSLIKDKIILIVDDLLTTGATASELSKVLLSGGARACYVYTIAHGFMDNTN